MIRPGPQPSLQPPLPLVQATCVLVGAGALLIRGVPGSGKSSLAAALIETADCRRPVRLVADDAVMLRASGGRLVAIAPDATRGLIEMRGLGIFPVAHEPRAVVRLVVDLVDADRVERLPAEEDGHVQIAGVRLPRVTLPAGDPASPRRVLAAFAALRPESMCGAGENAPGGRSRRIPA